MDASERLFGKSEDGLTKSRKAYGVGSVLGLCALVREILIAERGVRCNEPFSDYKNHKTLD
jgi:hypothetical protein